MPRIIVFVVVSIQCFLKPWKWYSVFNESCQIFLKVYMEEYRLQMLCVHGNIIEWWTDKFSHFRQQNMHAWLQFKKMWYLMHGYRSLATTLQENWRTSLSSNIHLSSFLSTYLLYQVKSIRYWLPNKLNIVHVLS